MSVLSEAFENISQQKIIGSFLKNDKLYVADIVRMTGVSKVTVIKHIKAFLADGILLKAGTVGKVQYYKLNCENDKIKELIKMSNC